MFESHLPASYLMFSSGTGLSRSPFGLSQLQASRGFGRLSKEVWGTANLSTKILDFRGLDSSRVLILRGEILMPIGNSQKV